MFCFDGIEKDHRRAFALRLARPLVTFCLFNASGSSPPLVVLREPTKVEEEMRRCAISYMFHFAYIEYGATGKTVWLPDVLRFYWKDFGGNRAKVLHNVMKLVGRDVQVKLDAIIAASNSSSTASKPKVNFISFDWTEMIVL